MSPLLVLGLILVPATPASAAIDEVANGDFEDALAGPGQPIPGWTAVTGLIDLGSTVIAGCTTVDTVDYSRLPLYGYERGIVGYTTTPTADADGRALSPADGSPIAVDGTGALVASSASGALDVMFDGSVLYYAIGAGTRVDVLDDDVADDVFETVFGLEEVAGQAAADRALAAINALFGATYPSTSDPLVRQDDLPALSETAYWRPSPQEFATEVVTSQTLSSSGNTITFPTRTLALSSQVKARTRSELGGETVDVAGATYRNGGYVAHGPAVYSDVFTTTRPMNLTLDWSANEDRDYFSVLGYVLNVDTCEQIEVIDQTGGTTAVSTARVTIPDAGDYRFVFVSGTYDYTWGTGAGANFYIDDIAVVPVHPDISLTPAFAANDPAGSAPLRVGGSDLRPASGWSLTLGPSGSLLGSDTVDDDGTFGTDLTLPADIAPGKYTITLVGVAANGDQLTRVMYITVNAQGRISHLSTTGPSVELAATGADTSQAAATLALVALLVGALTVVTARRVRRR